MTPMLLHEVAIGPALRLLPERMDSGMARQMLIAIAIQESDCRYRQQVLRRGRHWWEWRGPARGFWMFESAGLLGVLQHRATARLAHELLAKLAYPSPPAMLPAWLSEAHLALKYDDILAAGMARLLLWTLPQPLPASASEGWAQYLSAWRPGRERPEAWARSWRLAQEAMR